MLSFIYAFILGGNLGQGTNEKPPYVGALCRICWCPLGGAVGLAGNGIDESPSRLALQPRKDPQPLQTINGSP